MTDFLSIVAIYSKDNIWLMQQLARFELSINIDIVQLNRAKNPFSFCLSKDNDNKKRNCMAKMPKRAFKLVWEALKNSENKHKPQIKVKQMLKVCFF